MKTWNYAEARQKVLVDMDLQDETFITPDEMVGYFNEALNEAESEILVLNKDYFLTKYYIPTVQGTSRYELPLNIYATKIRGMMYKNQNLIYPIKEIKPLRKFEEIAVIEQFGTADYYNYTLMSDNVGQAQIELLPAARETSIVAPVGSFFTPFILWYLRNCARVPLIGEYCNLECIAPTQVDATANTITTYAGTSTIGTPQQGLPGAFPGSIAYVTGDAVKFAVGPNGTLPSPLIAGTVYYVIQMGSGVIKLATTKALALAGTAIDLTTTGTIYFTMEVAATLAIQNATLLDIPEFSTFVLQWVKCRCMEKEGDPRLEAASATLIQQKKQMVETLIQRIPDNDDKIQEDFSHYWEMN